MSAKRLDAVMAREYQSNGETKTNFSRIGVAFETRNGGWQVILDSMPAPTDGQYKILLMEPRQNNQGRSGGGNQGRVTEDIPFSCEWRV